MNKEFREILLIILTTAVLIFSSFVLVKMVLNRVLDHGIAQQDRMLCYSAQTSGNRNWATKCQCYYNGEDISCINLKRPLANE